MRYVSHAAAITISCSGLGKALVRSGPGGLRRSRAGADLQFTMADGEFFNNHFGTDGHDYEITSREWLIEPSLDELVAALRLAAVSLAPFVNEDLQNAGGIIICYAGHGAESTGAMILKDGEVSGAALVDMIAVDVAGTLLRRVDLVLDSCFAGAFLAEFLACISQSGEGTKVRIVDARIAALHKELAWEIPALSHGVMTYVFNSLFKSNDFQERDVLARAVNTNDQPTIRRLLHRYVPNPVSYLTEGDQHSVEVTNGHYVEVPGGGHFELLYEPFSPDQLERTLARALSASMNTEVEFAAPWA